MKENSPPKVRKVRRLSRFLCQELLYDFISGRLDPERAQAVKEYLYEDLDAQVDLESLDRALDYTEELSHTELTPDLLALLKSHKSWSARFLEALLWRNWPDMVRWSAEAMMISVIVAFVWLSFPWMKIVGVLPDQQHRELVRVEAEEPGGEQEKKLEEAAATHLAKQGVEVEEQKDAAEVEETNKKETTKNPQVSIKPVKVAKKAIVSETSAKISQPKVVAGKKVKVKDTSPKYKGLLYRGFMKIPNVRQITPDVVARIQELGGKKAGKVKLGWEKKTGNYFHFSLPESNYESLLKDLRQYGPVRIYKNPHWRVMPDGVIRFILLIEGTELLEPKEEAPLTTPTPPPPSPTVTPESLSPKSP